MRAPIFIEARVKKGGDREQAGAHKDKLLAYLAQKSPVRNWRPVSLECPELREVLDYVLVGADSLDNDQSLHVVEHDHVVFYSSKDYEPCIQEIFLDENGGDSAVSSTQWELPCMRFEKIWENLFYDDNIKGELLRFVSSVLTLSELGVDRDVIDINRLILLHGPPGTGKTSLCKGLAQRIASRFQNRFRRSVLIEVNSHSLFSKWFSESGKLVQKLFDQIVEMAEEPKSLVFVLVDEVESLVMRRSASNSTEPTDSIRAVNAVLTQIDRIRRYPNVLVLTTSNITDALDEAFRDRADLTKLVDHPSRNAAAVILSKAVGAVHGSMEDMEDRFCRLLPDKPDISGRMLKKLPVNGVPTLDDYIQQMKVEVDHLRCPTDRS